jgi:hypothetical protein
MGGANTSDPNFLKWKSQYAPNDSGGDYDLEGAYRAGIKPDSESGHFPDTFKKTNHPTFSNESKYSTPETPGGTWGVDAKGRNTFTPSQWMASDVNRMSSLQKYFFEREPNSTLILPNQQTTNMGGANPTPQTQVPSSPIADAEKEAATYARLKKQGMSDQGIVSYPELKKEVVDTAKELGSAINKKIVQPIAEGTANFFGRDASKPMSADDEIEMELRKSELGTK